MSWFWNSSGRAILGVDAQVLFKKESVKVSRETLRNWIFEDGLWLSRRHRRSFRQPRQRRESYGKPLQIAGSDHRWFEQLGHAYSLPVCIDDTNRSTDAASLVPSESASSYFECLCGYLGTHSYQVASYSDKQTVFRIKREPQGDAGIAQFSRVLAELTIDNICAKSKL